MRRGTRGFPDARKDRNIMFELFSSQLFTDTLTYTAESRMKLEPAPLDEFQASSRMRAPRLLQIHWTNPMNSDYTFSKLPGSFMKSMTFIILTPSLFTCGGTSSPTNTIFLKESFTLEKGLSSCLCLSGSSILYAD